MNTLWRDVRYAFRMLRRNPGFTVIAVLTLALGIGANTALFSVVNAVLLNPLPFPEPDRLVALYEKSANFNRSSISYPNFLDWQKDNRSLEAMAAFRPEDLSLTGAGEAERVRGQMISSDFFPVLGVQPLLGRSFTKQEDQIGGAPVAELSEGFWKRKFGGAADILGKGITLNGADYTVVGIVPSSFHLAVGNFHSSDAYIPIGQWNDPTFRNRLVGMGMDAVGRLRPGVALSQARADMDGVARNLAETYPDVDKGVGVTVMPLKQDVVGDIQPFLWILLGAVGFVLLIACVNVANLLLARSMGRSREFAIRVALGAGQTQILRQMLTESVLLGLSGGVLGLAVAAWGTRAALSVLPSALPRAEEIHLDARVLLFTLAVSVVVGIIFGLAPALKTARPDLHESLKEGGRGMSGARHRTQAIFVVAEMALALVLLVGAGLMIRSLMRLWAVDPGFNPHNVLTFGVNMPPSLARKSPAEVRATFRQLQNQLAAVPGVEASSMSIGALPMLGDSELPFWREDQPKPASDQIKSALWYPVDPSYFAAMQIPLRRGRYLTAQDDERSVPVIVIDEAMARKYFPGEDPLGKRLNLELIGGAWQIVGIVGHVKQWGLDNDAQMPIQAQLYMPMMQIPDQFMPLVARGVGEVVRTQTAPQSFVAPLRRAVEQVNSEQVVYDMKTMDDIVSDSLAARRFSMVLLGVFAALALLLASIGIYGVIAYVVGQRTHEIGIRMALGAQRKDVLRLVLGQGGKMALLGVAIGLAAALGLTRLMAKMLFGVSAMDPLTFVAVAFLLTLIALVACYIPARRAMRIDPMTALRYE